MNESPIETPASDHTAQTVAQAIMGNFQLSAQLPDGKSFSVSGYLFSGESVESLNARLDLLAGVTERQRVIAEIPELEKKLVAANDRLAEYLGFCNELRAKQERSPKQLSGQEKQQLDVMDVNVRKLREDIEKGVQTIAENKAKVGMT